MKSKKKTRAYKVGFTDGGKGKYNNEYPKNSKWYNDYLRGYKGALDI